MACKEVDDVFGILSRKFQVYRWILNSKAENADKINLTIAKSVY